MAENLKNKVSIKSLDTLFGRNEAQQPQDGAVIEIPLSELHPHPENPRTVKHNDKMDELIGLLKESGQQEPIQARIRPEGGYEIISGHRRHYALSHMGQATAKVLIRELSDDDAILAMCDSNSNDALTITEQAKAFELRKAALARKRGRPTKEAQMEKAAAAQAVNTPENVVHGGLHSKAPENATPTRYPPGQPKRQPKKPESARKQAAREMGISETTAHRLSKVKDLISGFQDMLDNKTLQLEQGSMLAQLKPEQQKTILNYMQKEDIKSPSKGQVEQLRFVADENALTDKKLGEIFAKKINNSDRTVTFKEKELGNLFPIEMTPQKIKEYMWDATVEAMRKEKTQQPKVVNFQDSKNKEPERG